MHGWVNMPLKHIDSFICLCEEYQASPQLLYVAAKLYPDVTVSWKRSVAVGGVGKERLVSNYREIFLNESP